MGAERMSSSSPFDWKYAGVESGGVTAGRRNSRFGSGYDAQRADTRKITIVRNKRCRIDRQSTGNLYRIRQSEAQRRTYPCRTLRYVSGEFHHLPGFQNRAIAPRQRIIASL